MDCATNIDRNVWKSQSEQISCQKFELEERVDEKLIRKSFSHQFSSFGRKKEISSESKDRKDDDDDSGQQYLRHSGEKKMSKIINLF